MAWLGKSAGIFKLHDSDNYCGSFICLEDTTEILGVTIPDLQSLPIRKIDNTLYISELDLHKAWGADQISSPYPHRIGNATRSFDELIIIKLLEITLPDAVFESQIQFGRRSIDIKVILNHKPVYIEFVGPSHFIPQYQRDLVSPLIRKKQVEDFFGEECIIWPFWIQRCSRNIKAIFDNTQKGLASVWSTKALFGDFQ